MSDACLEQCGPGAACISEVGGGKVCKPRCGIGSGDCPESATCALDASSQLNVCSYNTDACCYDTSAVCGAGVTCSGATPVLLDGECVHCATDSDCGGDICNTATNTCEAGECTGRGH